MKSFSHRGFLQTPEEKNTETAFQRTILSGFGTETDIRDLNGQLVVSHDPPHGGEMLWEDLLDKFDHSGLTLAVNIKSDGLATKLGDAFSGRTIDWFAFDMSGPEMVRYRKARLPYYTRHSDVEPDPILYDEASGVWLDAFDCQWFDQRTIITHLDKGKSVCVVSPELHGRDPHSLWQELMVLADVPGVILCTDKPDIARQVFRHD